MLNTLSVTSVAVDAGPLTVDYYLWHDPLVRLDIVMESYRRCDGKSDIQGRRCIVVNSNSWHCSFMAVDMICCQIRSECLAPWVEQLGYVDKVANMH
jgi:hypothetical protein